MELTKELLEKRIKNLEAQKAQMVANVNACEGGIVTIRGLLNELNCEESNEDNGDEQSSPSP